MLFFINLRCVKFVLFIIMNLSLSPLQKPLCLYQSRILVYSNCKICIEQMFFIKLQSFRCIVVTLVTLADYYSKTILSTLNIILNSIVIQF